MDHDLNKLNSFAFENLVVSLARKILGPGVASFGMGSDGGRDAVFRGQAPYPSVSEQWNGKWIIQAKFFSGKSDAGNKWLIQQVKNELKEFSNPATSRQWPDIWIIATNVDPSGVPETGSFDAIHQLVKKVRPELSKKLSIWGGKAILDYLYAYPEVAKSYQHLLTPGHVIESLLTALTENKASARDLIKHLVVDLIEENQNARLQDAGSKDDTKPGIHKIFIDLPYHIQGRNRRDLIAHDLLSAAHQPLKPSLLDFPPEHRENRMGAKDSKVWFVKAGPGRGKSTVGQYLAQLWRAAAVLDPKSPFPLSTKSRDLAKSIRDSGSERGHWPSVTRIPLQIELRDYATWMSAQSTDNPRGIVTYLTSRLKRNVESTVGTSLIREILKQQSWFFAFDGLDEVPSDLKDEVGTEVKRFIQRTCFDADCDGLFLITSRPQGYSGQFDNVDGLTVTMSDLTFDEAVECAKPLLAYDRTKQQFSDALASLVAAKSSAAVVNLMRTPLQSHIMAIVVRDGHKPPERRWKLFMNFYEVIKKREAAKKIADAKLYNLLSQEDKLLKTIHNRTGFVVHGRAEVGKGATTAITRQDFDGIVRDSATELLTKDAGNTAKYVSLAATERLVLVTTPDSGSTIRFDIRQLQEFFAGEFIYDGVGMSTIVERLKQLAGDAHWREVIYFTISAFIESDRTEDAWAASAILNDLNSSHLRGWNKAVCEAMGRGVYVVLHLAEEGVFEQDRRIRGSFSKALQGWFAVCTPTLLESLRFKRDSETLSWIIGEALGAVKKGQGMNEFGALMFLVTFLPDGNSEITEAKQQLLKVRREVLDLLLNHRITRLARSQPLQEWIYGFIAEEIAIKSFSEISAGWFHYIVNPHFTRFESDKSPITAPKSFQSRAHSCLFHFQKLIFDVNGADVFQFKSGIGGRDDIRILKEKLPPDLKASLQTIVDDGKTGKPGSILEMLSCASEFSLTRSKEQLKHIVDMWGTTKSWKTLGPIIGNNFLPFRLLSKLAKQPKIIDESFPDYVSNDFLMENFWDCFGHRFPIENEPLDENDWRSLCAIELSSAVSVAVQRWKWFTSADGMEFRAPLAEALSRDPATLRYFGKFWAELEQFLGPQVREILSSGPCPKYQYHTHFEGELTDFNLAFASITLPRESALLPYFAARLETIYSGTDFDRKRESEMQITLKDKIKGWDVLEKLIQNGNIPIIEREGALVIKTLLTDEKSFDENFIRNEMVALYSATSSQFFIDFISTWARRQPITRIDLVAEILGLILNCDRLTPPHRMALDTVVEHLRELSFAPITSGGLEKIWLSQAG